MEENPERDFMTTINKIGLTFSILLLSILMGSSSCNDQFVDGQIPPAAFSDIFINLDLPQYADLSIDGGYVLLNEGVRGIILYRVNASQYNAFERNCSYEPNAACATVEVHSSGLFLTDPCCGSSFSVQDGSPTGGPARLPLRRYTVIRDGRSLTITDEPLF
ncbi:MAG: Rieske (2Fe-2S) protein [Fulvivirga sp.]|nr:Rieske (2Fe-2S) protein [Fulvivirga sp.]